MGLPDGTAARFGLKRSRNSRWGRSNDTAGWLNTAASWGYGWRGRSLRRNIEFPLTGAAGKSPVTA